MQVDINQIGKGSTIEINKDVYSVINYQHVKPGKGGAFVRLKLKNLRLGTVIDKTSRAGEKVELAYVEKKNLQFLYSSKDTYEFMDHETYDQVTLHKEQLGEVSNCLKENIEVTAIVFKHNIITLEVPIFIDMKITSTEPGIRGNTSRSGTKPAVTETGMNITVPLFINEGDIVRIDTRTKAYSGRA